MGVGWQAWLGSNEVSPQLNKMVSQMEAPGGSLTLDPSHPIFSQTVRFGRMRTHALALRACIVLMRTLWCVSISPIGCAASRPRRFASNSSAQRQDAPRVYRKSPRARGMNSSAPGRPRHAPSRVLPETKVFTYDFAHLIGPHPRLRSHHSMLEPVLRGTPPESAPVRDASSMIRRAAPIL